MSKYTDMLGNPLEVGDYVAYPTNQGSGVCVASIVEFIDSTHPSRWCDSKWHAKVQPHARSDYKITHDRQSTVGNVHLFVKVVLPDGQEGK